MRMPLAAGLLCGLAVGLSDVAGPGNGFAVGGESPQGPIRVDVASGRTLSGELDAKTDRQTLWLRWTRGSASIRQPIPWQRIVRIHVGDQVLSGIDFVRTFDVPEAAPALAGDKAAGELCIRGKPATTAWELRGPEANAIGPASRFGPQASQVRSLAIEVQVANWNSGVEVDGLVVDVYPLDAVGRMMPVRGTLEVDLIGHQATRARPGRTFPQIGRWMQPVALTDFGASGARYHLAFQHIHPESEFSLAPFGVVHARLSVPGEGVFEASAAAVRIRPYSAVRDQLQRATGQRFFPQERTAAGLR